MVRDRHLDKLQISLYKKGGLGCIRHKEEDIEILKRPKHEIFEHGVFTQIFPVGVGDLGTRPKKFKKFMVGA
jgi:hypothetical protein